MKEREWHLLDFFFWKAPLPPPGYLRHSAHIPGSFSMSYTLFQNNSYEPVYGLARLHTPTGLMSVDIAGADRSQCKWMYLELFQPTLCYNSRAHRSLLQYLCTTNAILAGFVIHLRWGKSLRKQEIRWLVLTKQEQRNLQANNRQIRN